jgi:hypothetical protein
MLAYYLEMEPGLFESAVESQFERIKEERDAVQASTSDSDAAEMAKSESTDITLSSLNERIQLVVEQERRATVEDLMYMFVPIPSCPRARLALVAVVTGRPCTRTPA